jgi:hypothetical protein
MPDIEFTSIIEKGFLDVLLDDVAMDLSIFCSLFGFQSDFYIIENGTNSDTSTTIGHFSWFDNPYILALLNFFLFLEALIFL